MVSTEKFTAALRVTALLAPAAIELHRHGMSGEAAKWILDRYTGYNDDTGDFKAERLVRGWGPVLGFEVAQAGVAFIRSIME